MNNKKYISKRLENVQRKVIENKLDAILIANPKNCFYLSGYNGDGSFLITKEQVFYLTNILSLEEVKNSILVGEAFLLSEKSDLKKLFQKKSLKKVGFENGNMTVGRLDSLKKNLGETEFVGTENFVEEFRHIKDEYEISLINKAIEISHQVFKDIESNFSSYKNEKKVALDYEFKVRSLEASGLSFPTIVANGSGSAIPHYSKLDQKIDHKKPTLIDFGCIYQGYCSDHTRMIMPEHISEKEKKIYKLVEEAKNMAIKEIKPGADAKNIDQKVRDFFAKHKVEKYFTHTLGHSVGLDVHDGLVLSHKKSLILKEGMVLTIEPGLYFSGKFGVRLEDMVLVTRDGCEALEI